MTAFRTLTLSLLLLAASSRAAYSPVKDYSGQTFFDNWNFYDGWDEPTFGDVIYLGKDAAMQQNLTYVNSAGHAVVRVDNFTNVVWDNKRNSIRLESQDFYGPGTVWVMDATHMPFGCSVWPSWWTKAQTGWPSTGEIDIVEYVNLMQNNQMAVHGGAGCAVPPDQQSLQVGTPLVTQNCTADTGCTVGETKQNSLGAGFAAAGGGVYAAQFDATGVFIWFWSRPDIPNSIKQATATSTLDISDWGKPSAAWPASACNAAQIFQPQQMIITLTLCGQWANAGNGTVYQQTGCQGQCYQNNVLGDGSNYDNAYFEIPFIRAYSPEGQNTITSTNKTSTSPSGSASGSHPSPTVSGSPKPQEGNGGNGASAVEALASRTVIGLLMVFGFFVSFF